MLISARRSSPWIIVFVIIPNAFQSQKSDFPSKTRRIFSWCSISRVWKSNLRSSRLPFLLALLSKRVWKSWYSPLQIVKKIALVTPYSSINSASTLAIQATNFPSEMSISICSKAASLWCSESFLLSLKSGKVLSSLWESLLITRPI